MWVRHEMRKNIYLQSRVVVIINIFLLVHDDVLQM